MNGGYRYLMYCLDAPKIVRQTLATAVASTALVAGTQYSIVSVGTSNFTLAGAETNTVGCIFTATGATAGNGTAQAEVNTSSLIGNLQQPYTYGGATSKMLRDPYDIFTDSVHFPMSSVIGAGSTTADQSTLTVGQIILSNNSSALALSLDWTVEAFGYSAKDVNGLVENRQLVLRMSL
jgi:hypothetical protein